MSIFTSGREFEFTKIPKSIPISNKKNTKEKDDCDERQK
jgi:hypothetical protein